MSDKKVGPKLEYTYGLPRKRLYAPADEISEVASPPPRDRLTAAKRLIETPKRVATTGGDEHEIRAEEIAIVSDEDGLPSVERGSPTLAIRLTKEEIDAVDRVRGMRSRNSFVRVLVRRAVQAIEAQQA